MTTISLRNAFSLILEKSNQLTNRSINKASQLFQTKIQRLIKDKPYQTGKISNEFRNFLLYKAPRDPIVLCHGLYGYDIKGPERIPFLQTHYWPGIKEALEKLGCEVVITKVSQAGTIEQRAKELHNQLESRFQGRRIHLIGHSMGGLDSRFVITHIPNKSYKILSLTTLSTPHRGSSFVDWCREAFTVGLPKDHPSIANGNDQWFYKLIRYMLDQPAYFNLSCDYMQNIFNPNTPNCKEVQYFSYSTKVEKAPINPLLYFPHGIINKIEGLNDGIVSKNSSIWGQHIATINSNHMELLSTDKDGLSFDGHKQSFSTKDLFITIADYLSKRGF